MVVEPSGSPTTVPCDNLLRFVPGVCGVNKCIVAPDLRMPYTVVVVVLLVLALQLLVLLKSFVMGVLLIKLQLFNV